MHFVVFPGGGAFSIVFLVVVVLFVGALVFRMGASIVRWTANHREVVLTVPATVLSKRMHVQRQSSNTNGQITSSTTVSYYLTFRLEGALDLELKVRGQDYARLTEQDAGKLTYQGTRFVGFKS